MQVASIVIESDGNVYVACPYCYEVHRHGWEDPMANVRSSHCFKGDYRIEGRYDFRVAALAMKRREADIARKRVGAPQIKIEGGGGQ